jgi:glutamate-1-semialdehyde aminotransferase
MAKKSVKKESKKVTKVEMTETFNKVKDTAVKVNTQVLETATEVMDDMRENGKYWVETATQKVKDTVNDFDVADVASATVNTARETAKTANKVALDSAEDLVDVAFENGKKLQSITAKAIDGGFKIAAKQQDMVFTTLETVKGQLTKNASRFRDLFKAN